MAWKGVFREHVFSVTLIRHRRSFKPERTATSGHTPGPKRVGPALPSAFSVPSVSLTAAGGGPRQTGWRAVSAPCASFPCCCGSAHGSRGDGLCGSGVADDRRAVQIFEEPRSCCCSGWRPAAEMRLTSRGGGFVYKVVVGLVSLLGTLPCDLQGQAGSFAWLPRSRRGALRGPLPLEKDPEDSPQTRSRACLPHPRGSLLGRHFGGYKLVFPVSGSQTGAGPDPALA